jgi:hypothetical protein
MRLNTLSPLPYGLDLNIRVAAISEIQRSYEAIEDCVPCKISRLYPKILVS